MSKDIKGFISTAIYGRQTAIEDDLKGKINKLNKLATTGQI